MMEFAVSVFVSLMKVTVVSGIVMRTEVYYCEGENNTIKIPFENCKSFELLRNNRVIYSEEEGFVSPILGHPTDDDFLVQGCPVIVHICYTYNGEETRTTYTGMKINTTGPKNKEHSIGNTIRTLIIGLSFTLLSVVSIIVFACWCYKRRRLQHVPIQQESNRNPNVEIIIVPRPEANNHTKMEH